MHESAANVAGAFEIEHFRPKSLFAHRTTDYDNLYYVCVDCNRCKGAVWPGTEEQALGLEFVDPCKESLVGKHAEVLSTGEVVAKTPAGAYTIGHIRLNRRRLVNQRRLSIEQGLAFGRMCSELEAICDRIRKIAPLLVTNPKAVGELRRVQERLDAALVLTANLWRPLKVPHDEAP
ncbi:MAG: hypothetical protein DHS20C21_05290 [Gemmatimonadota bacterium]|nr:MAG: hypothetical protein DHS20C21_05290 [Gemmatimonadota bacterium]